MSLPPPASRLAALLALLVLLAACGGGDDEPRAEGDLSGMTVTVMGAFVEPADEAFREAVRGFEEETGATVEYEGSGDFETLINTRVGGGNPPDIGMFPQPGLMADFVASGDLRPLEDIVDTASLQESLLPGIYELGTVDGTYYGLPRVIAVKSVVWYPRQAFEDAGYEVPETWDELIALSDQMVEDGGDGQYPWCIGIESSGATGWVITDWIEDLLLRTAGPEAYDAWIAGDLPFNSPEVREAAERFAEIAFTDGYVLGGRQGIVTTPFGTAIAPLFEDPPACYLHRQASFIQGFLPADVDVDADVGIFYFPPVEGGFDGNPVLGSGDLAGLFTDNPAAEELLRYMSDPGWLGPQIDTGSDFAPFQGFPVERYPNEVTREQARLLEDADVFRFDASDSMPGVIGTGAFWTQMTAWVAGEVELEEALQNIDDAWPAGNGG
jgi:alpha-glucoside transport system substrate-binding protein